MKKLRVRLSPLLKSRTAALRAVSGTTFAGVTILAVAAISVAVLVLLGVGTQEAVAVRSAVPISMTRLIVDAKAGQLTNTVVDETSLVVQATYGPGRLHPAPPGAGAPSDGGPLGPGAVANASILSAYLPKVVDTLIAAGVPVHPGT
ncbi:MAG TPA: hypothetical protein VIJ15_12045, partial [Dermatophilaceae bacterium]